MVDVCSSSIKADCTFTKMIEQAILISHLINISSQMYLTNNKSIH